MNNIIVRFLIVGILMMGCFAIGAVAQNSNACIISQPLPERPADYGTLDAQTSVMFRAEFLSDGTLGKIPIVKSAQIKRLDDLASEAVAKIRFKPKKVNGSPVTSYEILIYRYSWRFTGWRVERLKSLRLCAKEK